ncbi:MAG: hypothetical protein JO180_09710 [Gemmatirosa sp.]|nr:hypothetical protein [Gemmatirosa sp.]
MTVPPLDRLLADVGAPVHRIVFARGVEAWRESDDAWRPPKCPGEGRAAAALEALGLRPVERRGAPVDALGGSTSRARAACPDPVALAVRHGLAPLVLATAAALGGETLHVVSSAGATGWRPPLERLYQHPALGLRARRLRFLLDGVEHHATRAAEAHASAAAAARRTATLFGARELTTLTGQTTLFVELDALLAAVQRTYGATGRLLTAAYPARRTAVEPMPFDTRVLAARGAPSELRESLLDAWESHGAHAGAYRRALRARDARELGQAPVQLVRLAPELWGVSVPVTTPATERGGGRRAPDDLPRRVDALDRAWAMATDAMRAAALVTYAVDEERRM